MRVLLLGAGGMLGHDLAASAPPKVTLVSLARAQLDITRSDAVAATLAEVQPQVVINAAAYTLVDRAEAESQAALAVNGAAVGQLARLARRAKARVVNDQLGRPTYTRDLAVAVWRLIGWSACGLMHLTNHGQATWFDVAARVFARAGRPDLLTPCATADYPTKAKRPRYSVLDTERAEKALGGALPNWEDAIDRFLATIDS